MSKMKKPEYAKMAVEAAKFAKALGHPARIAILQLLLKRQTCICSNIVEELPIAQSTVSQHLKALKEAGLIKGEIEGTSICYCIDEKVWHKAKTYLTSMFDQMVENKGNCC